MVASRDIGEGEYSKKLKGEARSDVSSSSSSSPPPSSSQSTGSGTASGAGSMGAATRGKREPWVEKNVLNKKDYLQLQSFELFSQITKFGIRVYFKIHTLC